MKERLFFKNLPSFNELEEHGWYLVIDNDDDMHLTSWDADRGIFWDYEGDNCGVAYGGVKAILPASELEIVFAKDIDCECCAQQPCEIFRNACEKKRKELGVTDEDWDSEERYDLLREICVETSKNCMYKTGVD